MKKILLILFVLAVSYSLKAQVANPAMNSGNSVYTSTVWAALPVLETWVPQDIISKMQSKYGEALYDITTIVGTTDKTQYVVRSLKDNAYTTDYFDGDGNPLSK